MLKLTEHKKGLKMEGFLSLNTAPSCNDFCMKMRENKASICSQCYAKYMETRYPRLKRALIDNFNDLTSYLSPMAFVQITSKINHKKNLRGVRIHSLGEFSNADHVKNIFNFIRGIQVDIPITIWSKRINLIKENTSEKDRAMCNIIESNPRLNSYIRPSMLEDFILHSFNVYDNEMDMHRDMYHAMRYEGVKTFECRGSCKDCMVCYPKMGDNMPRMAIFELTKKAQSKTR